MSWTTKVWQIGKEIGLSSVKMAVASEVSGQLRKGARAVIIKTAELAGVAPDKTTDEDEDQTVFIDENIIEVKPKK